MADIKLSQKFRLLANGQARSYTVVTQYWDGTVFTNANIASYAGGLYNVLDDGKTFIRFDHTGVWETASLTSSSESNFRKLVRDFPNGGLLHVNTPINFTQAFTIPANIKLLFSGVGAFTGVLPTIMAKVIGRFYDQDDNPFSYRTRSDHADPAHNQDIGPYLNPAFDIFYNNGNRRIGLITPTDRDAALSQAYLGQMEVGMWRDGDENQFGGLRVSNANGSGDWPAHILKLMVAHRLGGSKAAMTVDSTNLDVGPRICINGENPTERLEVRDGNVKADSYVLKHNVSISSGIGSPEAIVFAQKGSKYIDVSTGCEYTKNTAENSNMGWVNDTSETEVFNEITTNITDNFLTFVHAPIPNTVRIYKNGIRLILNVDYQLDGGVLLTNAAVATDYFITDYKY